MGEDGPVNHNWAWDELPTIDLGFNGNRTRAKAEDWSLVLKTGRSVRLDALYQQDTTRGMLCGLPLPHVREQQIEDGVNTARHVFRCRQADRVYVLPPTLYRYTANLARPSDPPNICELNALPPVCSMGEFLSGTPVRDQEHVYSSLVVLWFQGEYGLPTDARVLELLRAMPWDDWAGDWSP